MTLLYCRSCHHYPLQRRGETEFACPDCGAVELVPIEKQQPLPQRRTRVYRPVGEGYKFSKDSTLHSNGVMSPVMRFEAKKRGVPA